MSTSLILDRLTNSLRCSWCSPDMAGRAEMPLGIAFSNTKEDEEPGKHNPRQLTAAVVDGC